MKPLGTKQVPSSAKQNLTTLDDPACLLVDMSTSEGRRTGLALDSVAPCLAVAKRPGPGARAIGKSRSPAVDLR